MDSITLLKELHMHSWKKFICKMLSVLMYHICVQGIRLLKNSCCILTQRMHCQKPRESLDACAQEGSSRVLHRVLTMTFSDFWVLNHAPRIPLNVAFFYQQQIITFSPVSLLSRFPLCFEARQLLCYTISSFNMIYKCLRIWLSLLEKDSISRETVIVLSLSLLRGENSLILTLTNNNS